MEPITSIEAIAREASTAALQWTQAAQGSPKPANPYNRLTKPDYHRAWNERFEIALIRFSRKEAA